MTNRVVLAASDTGHDTIPGEVHRRWGERLVLFARLYDETGLQIPVGDAVIAWHLDDLTLPGDDWERYLEVSEATAGRYYVTVEDDGPIVLVSNAVPVTMEPMRAAAAPSRGVDGLVPVRVSPLALLAAGALLVGGTWVARDLWDAHLSGTSTGVSPVSVGPVVLPSPGSQSGSLPAAGGASGDGSGNGSGGNGPPVARTATDEPVSGSAGSAGAGRAGGAGGAGGSPAAGGTGRTSSGVLGAAQTAPPPNVVVLRGR